MTTFKQQPIRQRQTIGERLRASRQMQERSVAEIAEKLKIAERYLDALERGRYNDMPSPVYIKNFLKRYAQELGLAWDRLEEQFTQEIGVYKSEAPIASVNQKEPKIRSRRESSSGGVSHQRKALELPRLLKLGAAGIVVLLVAIYFSWEIVQLLSPPDLTVLNPASDEILTTQKITVVGLTEPEAIVEINGQAVPVEPDGSFSDEVFLHEGLNAIQVSTRSKRSRARAVIRNVLYDAANDPDRPELLPADGTVPEAVVSPPVEDGATVVEEGTTTE